MHSTSRVGASARRFGVGRWPLLAAAVLALLASPAIAQEEPAESPQPQEEEAAEAQQDAEVPPAPTPQAEDGAVLPVSSIGVRYALEHPALPPPETLEGVTFELLATEQGYVGPRAQTPGERHTIASLLAEGEVRLYRSAVLEISRAIAQRVIDAGIVGVYVMPDESQIDRSGRDVREEGDRSLTLVVHVGEVTDVRTVGSGDRVAYENRINNRKHARIRNRSPIRPAEGEDDEAGIVRSRQLEDYVLRLNRHPGRRVDVAIGPGEGTDEAVLDYLVQENRPLRLYAQVSNTGTEQTNEWRERFGLTHTQLTGNDDILSVEYATASFSDSHAFQGSYDAPLFASERLRWRVAGLYNEYQASDVGASNLSFNGDLAEGNAELLANVFQHRDLFVDAFAGARFFNSRTENFSLGIEGEEAFFVPRVGIALERYRSSSILDASLSLEASMPDVTGVDETELQNLGRLDPDRSWQVLRGNLRYSFFVEPLLAGGYRPGEMTLAHEIALALRGQWAFDKRLIPTEQQVAGGFYSVRGYRESVAAGDSVAIASAEYRFHWPRTFEPDDQPRRLFGQRFRYAPESPGGRPDWDLILRGFLDAAYTTNSDSRSFESDETLVGTGVGLELVVKRNISFRADWGIALTDLDGANTAGSNRFHFVATILY